MGEMKMIDYISSSIRHAAKSLCGKKLDAELIVLDGPSTTAHRRDIYRVSEEMRDGYFDEKIAIEKLLIAEKKPVNITETWILLGIFDPGIKALKTDLRHLLKPYVSDFNKIKLETNASAAFKNLSIDELALKFINKLIATHDSSIEETVRINIVAHSMGGAIATRAIALLSQLNLSKKFIIENALFLSSPIQGAEISRIGGAVACCCKKNIMRDLMPENSVNRLNRINGVKSTYMISRYDSIIDKRKAAPAGSPVVLLDTTILSAHTDILKHPVTLSRALSL